MSRYIIKIKEKVATDDLTLANILGRAPQFYFKDRLILETDTDLIDKIAALVAEANNAPEKGTTTDATTT